MKNEILETQLRQGRLKDVEDFPRVILIDTISHCNLRCAMCGHKDMKRKKGVMPWQLFTKIVDEIAEVNKDARVWMVFFGEALMLRKKPTIFDMIAYAKKRGLTDVVLNSNGNLLDEDAARGLIDSGLDAIYIGIDAFKKETYAKIRVGGDYDSVVCNVKNLIEKKLEMNSSHPKIYIQFVEMDINIHEREDFINFWKGYDVTVKIRPKVSWAGLVDAPSQRLDNKERWPCHWAMQTMSITDTGRAVTCAVDVDARFIAGDANKEFLEEIWNGTLKKLRKLHLSKEFEKLPDLCRDCRDWQSARAEYYSSGK